MRRSNEFLARSRILLMTSRLALIAAGALLTVPALALADSARFDIPAGSLPQALKAFATQAHMQLLYQYDAVKSAHGNAVSGEFDKHAALEQLLRNSGLEAVYASDTAATIRPIAHAVSDFTSEPPGAPGAEPQKDSLQLGQTTSQQGPGNTSVEKLPGNYDKAGELQEVHPSLPEILIEGSRIMNVDVKRTEDDVLPYTILTSEQIERSGAANVEDFLKQQLTMNVTSATNAQTYASPAGTTSSINLRGLGSNETLILIDGRRTAGVNIADGFSGLNQPDINGIPLSAIERIEVLPSSASAIYGGAAVGGVVNIVLKKNFDGGDFRYTYEKPGDSNAHTSTVSASFGHSFHDGATQIMLAGQYSDGTPLLTSDRTEFIDRGVSLISENAPTYLFGPYNPFPGATPNISGLDAFFAPTNLILRNGTPLNASTTFIPVGAAPGSNLSQILLANAGRENLTLAPTAGLYGLDAPLETTPTTKSLFGTVRQALFDYVTLFGEFSTQTNAGRTLFDPFSQPFFVPAGAPTNPFLESVFVTFPTSIAIPSTSDSVTHSATVGLIAPLGSQWHGELDYTWSRNSFESASGNVDSVAFGNALATGAVDPFVDTIERPLNLTPYLTSLSYAGNATLNDLAVRVAGPLFALSSGAATLTVGLEHRKETAGQAALEANDPATPANDTLEEFFAQAQTTDSVYAEALLPVVGKSMNVPMVHGLDLEVAGRSERYTVDSGTPFAFILPVADQAFNPPQGAHTSTRYTSTNPAVGLKYQPVAALTLRASYSTAFLPPTASQFLPNLSPSCPGAVPCAEITDPENRQSYFVNYTSGGNPDLKPQRSRDWDFGLILEPQGGPLQGLRVNVQYYRIVQPDYITTPTIQQFVDEPSLGSHVTRDPATGLITNVNLTPVNAIEYQTAGWDVRAQYRKETTWGTLGFDTAATFIRYDLRQSAIGLPFLQYAGYPNDGGEGKVKAAATLSWKLRQWNVAWTTTYYGSYWQTFTPGSPNYILNGPISETPAAQGGNSVPSQVYHDLFVSYALGDSRLSSAMGRAALSNWTVQLGIKNVFNTLPPFDANFIPYFYSPYGDPRLRTFRATVTKTF